MLNEKFKIWYIMYDDDGNEVSRGRYVNEYVYMSRAYTIARKQFGDHKKFRYIVSRRDPWAKYKAELECKVCGKMHLVEESPDGFAKGPHILLYNNAPGTSSGEVAYGHICPECYEQYVKLTELLRNGFEKKTRPYTLGELPGDDIYAD